MPNKWWHDIFGKEDFKVPLVQIEQPNFERAFDVHSTNATEARYLLTTKMIEAILGLKKKYKTDVCLSFVVVQVSMVLLILKKIYSIREY